MKGYWFIAFSLEFINIDINIVIVTGIAQSA